MGLTKAEQYVVDRFERILPDLVDREIKDPELIAAILTLAVTVDVKAT